jgi:hypothetical protein
VAGLPAEWLETEQAEAALRVVCLRVILKADPKMRADLLALAVDLLVKDLLDGRRRVRKLLPEDCTTAALWAKDAPLLDGLVETEVGLDPTATRWSASRSRSAELWGIRCAVPELRAAELALAAQTVRWTVDRDALVRVAVGRRLALLPEAHQQAAEAVGAGVVLGAGPYQPTQGDRVTLQAQTEAMLPRLQLVTAGMLLRDAETLRGLPAEDRAALEQPLAELTADLAALEQAAKAAGLAADAGNPAAWGKGSRWVRWAMLRWDALAAEWAAVCKRGAVVLEGPLRALVHTATLAPSVLRNRPQDLWEVRVQPAAGGEAVAVSQLTVDAIGELQKGLQVAELLPLVWWLARMGAIGQGAPWRTRTLTEVETGCGTRRNASGANIVEAARALQQLVVNITEPLPEGGTFAAKGLWYCKVAEYTLERGKGRSQVLEWTAGPMLRQHNLGKMGLESSDYRNRGFRSIALPEAPAPIASNRHTQQERLLQGEVLAELSRRSPEYAAQKGLPLTVQEWKTLLDRAGLAWANGKTKDGVLEAWTQNRAQQTGGQLVLPLPGQGPFLDGDALESGLVRLSEVTHSGTHRWLLDGGAYRAERSAAAKTQAGKPRKRKPSKGAK